MERLSLSAASSLPNSPLSESSHHHSIARRPRTPASMSPALDPTTGETGHNGSRAHPHETSSTPKFGRPRTTTVQSDIQETIQHPGNVRINVQGAFIVDEEQPGTPQSEDYEHDPHDIRLPNHTSVVSHVAVDVSVLKWSCAWWVAARDQVAYQHHLSMGNNLLICRVHRRLEVPSQNSYTSRANPATTRSAAD
jgi:hypothetical protein